jgi:branched-chain amino acid transport system permease protein
MNDQTRLLPQSPAGRIAVALLFGLLAIIPAFVSTYHVELITTALIAGMLALSLQLLVGATGLVSLGHGAFYGLAAYVVYLVSPEGTAQPIWLTLPLAMAVAALAALAIGALSLRTKGFFFLMVTLAFGQMIFFVFHDTKLGGGTDGAYLAKPLITLFGQTLDLPRRQKPLGPYYVALLQLGIMYLGLAWLLRSLFGRVLEGIRANEHRMQAIGYNTYRYKLAAFVIAGSLAGAAGHMWALHRGFVNPELIGWHKSAEALLMILLGGLGSLAGPIVGALAYTALGEFSGLITERKLLVEGLVILAVVLILPHGITGIKFWRSPGLPKPTDAQLGTTDASLTQATREASAND